MTQVGVARSGTCMPMAEFESLFAAGAIRTWVDWAALDDTNCHVRAQVCTTSAQLGSCDTVWYRVGDQPAEWRDEQARRARVAEVAAGVEPEGLDGTFLDAPHVFPALNLGDGRVMLLDGNHRAVAMVASGQRFHVLLMVLTGPMDPMIFPDLIHERGCDASDPAGWAQLVTEIDRKFLGS